MELISIRELFKNTAKYADQTIEIGGWVRNRRPSKQFGFIMLSDGTGAATSEGVQATALVACIFVACALGIYFFYNDNEITAAIQAHNEEK